MMIFRQSRCAWHARISAGGRMRGWMGGWDCSVEKMEKIEKIEYLSRLNT